MLGKIPSPPSFSPLKSKQLISYQTPLCGKPSLPFLNLSFCYFYGVCCRFSYSNGDATKEADADCSEVILY
ncbi:hypothetical protein ES332_D10G277300v1 [Gossypium tomentosum]|uniref:Uncharacterized protein n=1 Tax=Gossypium tomentosum TaxID=34277 RepID=A0A5D2JAM4_GOSTO|nr:hypothetical protein ES332_D10G277300v1 [Gossypium tomentosum]